MKEYYKDEPLFKNSKVVVSIYGSDISGQLNSKIVKKIEFDEINSESLAVLQKSTYSNLLKNAILNSDGIIFADDNVDESILDFANKSKKPILNCGFVDGFKKEYLNFYSTHILG